MTLLEINRAILIVANPIIGIYAAMTLWPEHWGLAAWVVIISLSLSAYQAVSLIDASAERAKWPSRH